MHEYMDKKKAAEGCFSQLSFMWQAEIQEIQTHSSKALIDSQQLKA